MAREIGHTPLHNGNSPKPPGLTEADIAKMEAFLASLMVVLPAIRVDMFIQRSRPAGSIGHFASWRIAMFIMTGLAVVLLVFIAIKLPPVAAPSSSVPGGVPTIRSREAFRNFGLVVLVNVVFFFAHNLLYTYVTPLLLQHGVAENDRSSSTTRILR